jgi:NAD(P)-dependent dehydrogenase (short-subunit alcohol dehydrogenase family)
MAKLSGKIALVTGAGSGIGKGIACALADEGASIIIAGRRLDKLRETTKQIENRGGVALAVQTDVTDETQVCNLFKRGLEIFSRLDILVNNAGLVDGCALDELGLAMWNKLIATNLTGPFLCTREAMRVMKRQGGGRIINIGSISAQRPRANSAPYSSSKFGIQGLTFCTALEGREYGISASCIHPGNVRTETPTSFELDSPGEAMMEVREFAEIVVLIASLPAHMNMLETIVLPVKQPYLARG